MIIVEASPNQADLSKARLTAIILTFNSENSIDAVLDSLQGLATRIVVVDSYSRDGTRDAVEKRGLEFVEHEFVNYSQQRRWAQAHVQVPEDEWLLHVDSDEVLSEELSAEVKRVRDHPEPDIQGYLVRRLSFFWGRPIRHGHMNPSWHLRLYRSGAGMCEDRLYDQHFICSGPTAKLKGDLLDLQLVSLQSWITSHNRWSSAEAEEAETRVLGHGNSKGQLRESLTGDLRERKRWVKNRLWYRTPLLARSFVFFIYSYFFKLGFLDGKSGFVFHVLHAFWFRFVVDAKILERRGYLGFVEHKPPKDWLVRHGAAGAGRQDDW